MKIKSTFMKKIVITLFLSMFTCVSLFAQWVSFPGTAKEI